ncbi:hypothetical protein VTJ04DRAFT_4458 [Mycothermus thermophilus]|uniref:uncharacterized protein n=1 Tax=Humicola insolens TaxID=85995 RepID=UPI003742033E
MLFNTHFLLPSLFHLPKTAIVKQLGTPIFLFFLFFPLKRGDDDDNSGSNKKIETRTFNQMVDRNKRPSRKPYPSPTPSQVS